MNSFDANRAFMVDLARAWSSAGKNGLSRRRRVLLLALFLIQ